MNVFCQHKNIEEEDNQSILEIKIKMKFFTQGEVSFKLDIAEITLVKSVKCFKHGYPMLVCISIKTFSNKKAVKK